MKLTIPGRLPGLNEIIALSKQGRGGYQPYAQEKSWQGERIYWLCKKQGLKQVNKADIHIHFIEPNRRRDKDNIIAGTKFILDGLVNASILESDGWRHIGDLSFSFAVDKENPRVEVTLEEVK